MKDPQRLQKILAEAGYGSRRACEELIELGDVTINGRVAKLGDKADPEMDHIKVNGKLMKAAAAKVVVVMFKPRGMITHPPATDDPEVRAPTILDAIPRIKERVKPVGRLDSDAEGLMLLTNDTELLTRLTKPSFEIEKKFIVKVDGHLDPGRVRRLTHGVEVEGKRTKPCTVTVRSSSEGKGWVEVITTEPRNRHIRKMFEAVGRPVDKVRRESYAGITLKGLVRGQYRYLTDAEFAKLRELVGMGRSTTPAATPKKASKPTGRRSVRKGSL